MKLSQIATVPSLVVLLGLFGGPGTAAAEKLTLAEAMAAARQRPHEVRAAAARVEAGEEQLREARSYRIPTVRLQEIWMRTDSPAEAFALVLNQERFSLAEFAAGDPNRPQEVDNALTRLEVELPLYTGGEIRGRIRQAELAAAAARHDAAWVEDQAAWQAAEAYLGLVQVREQVTLLERSLATIEAHVELARAYLEQGLVVRSELLRAEVERARITELVVEARGRERVVAAHLAFRIGGPQPEEWSLEPLPAPAELAAPLDEWLASAEGRFDLEAARRRLEAGRLEEAVRRSAGLPRVGLVARHDRNDRSLFGSGGQSSAIVAMAAVDLFAGGRHRAAAARARAEAEAAALDVQRFREGVRVEVRDAYERALAARQRRATAVTALAAARESERIVGRRFAEGIGKTLDVLDAMTARREAETRELVARAEAHLASLRLAVVAGRRPESGVTAAFDGVDPDGRSNGRER